MKFVQKIEHQSHDEYETYQLSIETDEEKTLSKNSLFYTKPEKKLRKLIIQTLQENNILMENKEFDLMIIDVEERKIIIDTWIKKTEVKEDERNQI